MHYYLQRSQILNYLYNISNIYNYNNQYVSHKYIHQLCVHYIMSHDPELNEHSPDFIPDKRDFIASLNSGEL